MLDVGAPVLVPAAFEGAPASGRTWSSTREGAVVAPQRMADSFLDLEGKESLAAPWDVHAAKLVDCVACHYARNSPSRSDGKQGALRYLTAYLRRQTQAEFLVRPDHRLAELDCRACHDPMKAHAFLPYRERHMEVLSCTACHASGPMGPPPRWWTRRRSRWQAVPPSPTGTWSGAPGTPSTPPPSGRSGRS